MLKDIRAARSTLEFKSVDGKRTLSTELEGAVATIKPDGTVQYQAPQGLSEFQDRLVVEVFDKKSYGSDKPSEKATIVIPVSSEIADQVLVTSEEDVPTCGCSTASSHGAWAWLLGLLAVLGLRRRRRVS